jgi:hypothetical protein
MLPPLKLALTPVAGATPPLPRIGRGGARSGAEGGGEGQIYIVGGEPSGP